MSSDARRVTLFWYDRTMPPQDPSTRPDVTSRTLLERAVGQDPDAWQRIVHLCLPLVRTWCLRFGVRVDDVDDVSQEVFRAAVGRLSEFRRDRPGDTFRGWLRVISRNQAIVHHRRGKGAHAAGGSTAHLALSSVEDPLADDDEDSPAEVSALYHRALELVRAEFETRTWEMFWNVVVDERPTADVAAAFSVSPAAVRQAKARVLRRLKEEVGDVI